MKKFVHSAAAFATMIASLVLLTTAVACSKGESKPSRPVTGPPDPAVASQSKPITLCWAAWDPANALV